MIFSKQHISTPAVLVDEAILKRNIARYQTACNNYNKHLWPMIKTHKSTAIAKMQQEQGACGFLCGTLDECEALASAGISNIMYAYPVASQPALSRAVELARRCNFFARIDGAESGRLLAEAAIDVRINYTIIIDSGLHRFGVRPNQAVELACALAQYPALCLRGISTHPGHVYAASSPADVRRYTQDEKNAMSEAACALETAGYRLDFISGGSTPTFMSSLSDETIKILHPGNYVFNDAVQITLGAAATEDCALTILATVVSSPHNGIFIIDAGSKTLGLDKGAHGNAALNGYGIIKNHPNLTISALSEEVGKIEASADTTLKVGDKIEIIPNHACVPANLTSFLILCRENEVVGSIEVDIRGNSLMYSY